MRERVYQECSVVLLILLAAVFAPANVWAQGVQSTQNKRPPFSLTIRAKDSEVKSGLPILVDATVENKSDHAISIYKALSGGMDQGGWVYKVDVLDETSTRAPETTFYRRLEGHVRPEEFTKEPYVTTASGVVSSLEPGKAITDRVNVSTLYNLNRPGKYTIQFRDLDAESKAFILSNKITVTVTP